MTDKQDRTGILLIAMTLAFLLGLFWGWGLTWASLSESDPMLKVDNDRLRQENYILKSLVNRNN